MEVHYVLCKLKKCHIILLESKLIQPSSMPVPVIQLQTQILKGCEQGYLPLEAGDVVLV